MKRILTTTATAIALLLSACNLFQSEDEGTRVSSFLFASKSYTIQAGEAINIPVVIEPSSAVPNVTVSYETNSQSVIELGNKSANGVVVTGLATGTDVIRATCGNYTDYCEITVEGILDNVEPYIVVPYSVFETEVGKRTSISVSLYGGNPSDNSQFVWAVDGSTNIGISTATNTAVITGTAPGVARITVSHPKADYSASILVYVLGATEKATYITTAQNVVTLNGLNTQEQIYYSLVGGTESDKSSFTYRILEGSDVVSINASSDVCVVTAKAIGTARIQASNPKSQYPIETLVIVRPDESNNSYIEVDSAFVVLRGSETSSITASIIGTPSSTAYQSYSYTVSDASVLQVTQLNNLFSVKGIKTGSTLLTISNSEVAGQRVVLVIVEDQSDTVYSTENYIHTNQNVIEMCMGDTDVNLSMTLIGGTQADKNNFSWVVDDGSIISLASPDGTVSYIKAMALSSSITPQYVTYTTNALITPKGVGTTKITLNHPKAVVPTTVLVKVYPKGTFASKPLALKNNNGILKITTGTSNSIKLGLSYGSESDVGNLTWSSSNTSVMTVAGTSLEGIVTGVASGIADITISGSNLNYPLTVKAIIGTAEEILATKCIYVEDQHPSTAIGQTIYIPIQRNGELNPDNDSISVVDTSIASVRSIGNTIIIQGLKEGTTEARLENSGTVTSSTLFITVKAVETTIDHPYYLKGDSFIGVVLNGNKTASISLVGAPDSQKTAIRWSSGDATIFSVAGSGESAVITGKAVGQAELIVEHSKSANRKIITVYVAQTATELTNAIALSSETYHYLVKRGGTQYIKINTNGNDIQKGQIQYSISDASIISINSNADTAVVSGSSMGTAVITVSHPNAVASIKIYISVVDGDGATNTKDIQVTPIVEMVIGENNIINAQTVGMTYEEIEGVIWSIDDSTIASISGNGAKAYIIAKKAGIANITVRQNNLAIQKNIVLACAASEEALAAQYYMSVANSYQKMNIGEKKKVTLSFGASGFPEGSISSINWQASNNGVVTLIPNGKEVTIQALNIGVAEISVSSSIASNTVRFRVDVSSGTAASGTDSYTLTLNDSIGIIIGQTSLVSVDVSDTLGNKITSAYQQITWSVADPTIASIAGINNECRIRAIKAGATYVTAHHPRAQDMRILVYAGIDQSSIDNTYPLATDKDHYRIAVGNSINIEISTKDALASNINQIQWTVSTSEYATVEQISKTNARVTGKKVGNTTITVSHPGSPKPVVFEISVVEAIQDNEYRMLTENIIGLVVGTQKATQISTNIEPALYEFITWESLDPTICKVTGSGIQATLSAVSVGEAQIKVKYSNNLERILRVYVSNTEAEVNSYSAMNIDKRYYSIPVGGQIYVAPYYAPIRPASAAIWEESDISNCIGVSASSDGALIVGNEVGLATIKVTNASCNAQIVLTIEVTSSVNTGNVTTNDYAYITSLQTMYVLDPEETGKSISISVVGKNFTGDAYFEWSNTRTDLIELTANGTRAIVRPLATTGTSTITVSNPHCNNILVFTIKIGPTYTTTSTKVPYIFVEKTVVTMKLGGESAVITPSLVNVASIDPSASYSVTSDKEGVVRYQKTVVGNSTQIVLTPLASGQANITIQHPQSSYTAVVSVIVEAEDNTADAIYLTTNTNYLIVGRNQSSPITVTLKGYTEYDSSRYTWSTDNSSIATVVGSGTTVQVVGVSVGEATLTVTHPRCIYPLSIKIKVVDSSVGSQAVYLTTASNVIETTVSETLDVLTVNLVGASGASGSFTWTVSNANVLALNGNGNTAFFRGKMAGTTRITVSHPQAAYELNIVVVVEEPVETENYISTKNTIVTLNPGQTGKNISVVLEGGEERDNNAFEWCIYSQNPADANVAAAGGNVITLSAVGTEGVVNAINTGTAIIRVVHPKSQTKLNITVYVTEYDSLQFDTSSLEIVAGTTTFVNIHVPNYDSTIKNITYSTDNNAICTVVGTNNVAALTGIAPGFATIRANSGGTNNAEIYVTVKNALDANIKRIATGQTTVSLSPRDAAKTLTARIMGNNVTDNDQDKINWAVADKTVLSVFPSSGIGREIQISPLKTGNTTITITHPDTTDKQVIYVEVSESDNTFTLSRQTLTMMADYTEEITATIIGGTSKEYDKIIWTSTKSKDQSGTYIDIVRIMGQGQKIQIYGIAAGECDVTGFYNGLVKTCHVVVQESNVFQLESSTVQLYPGETRDINYALVPSSTWVTWYSSEAGSSDPVIGYSDVASTHKLRLTANREGTASITGIASNGKKSTITIKSSYTYSVIDVNGTYTVAMTPLDKNKAMTYKVYPPNTIIKLSKDIPGATIDIGQPDTSGTGVIYFNTNTEVAQKTVVFNQYTTGGTMTGASLSIVMQSMYTDEVITPMFQRYDGYWSNGANQYWNTTTPLRKEALAKANGSYTLDIGDGETHYIVLDKKYDNSIVDNINVSYSSSTTFNTYLTASVVDVNGNKVIQIKTMNPDTIIYNRTGFPVDLISTVTQSFNSGSSIYTYRYNLVKNTFELKHEDGTYSPAIVAFTNDEHDEGTGAWPSYTHYGWIMASSINIGGRKYCYIRTYTKKGADGIYNGYDDFFDGSTYYEMVGEYQSFGDRRYLTYQDEYWQQPDGQYVYQDLSRYLSFANQYITRKDIKVVDANDIRFTKWPFNYRWLTYTYGECTAMNNASQLRLISMPTINTAVVTKQQLGSINISFTRPDGASTTIIVNATFTERNCHHNFNPYSYYTNQDGETVLVEPRGEY